MRRERPDGAAMDRDPDRRSVTMWGYLPNSTWYTKNGELIKLTYLVEEKRILINAQTGKECGSTTLRYWSGELNGNWVYWNQKGRCMFWSKENTFEDFDLQAKVIEGTVFTEDMLTRDQES